MTNVIEELAEDFERMHANGDVWVTAVAVTAKLRQAIAAMPAGGDTRHERANEALRNGLRELHSILAKPESDTAAVVSAYIVVTDTTARADAILKGEA